MSKPKKKKNMPLRYFFFNDLLHKKIHIQRSADLITAFRYSDGKLVKYVYSEVKRNGHRAYTTQQVAGFLNRRRLAIQTAISNGNIRAPQMSYSIDEKRNSFAYFWREEDVMDAHAYFASVHTGRPRKDGLITNGRGLPSARELRAMLRTGTVMGHLDENGKFIPTWQSENDI